MVYTEKEVENILETQRGNCYVAVFGKSKDKKLASLASNAPEPGLWRKNEKKVQLPKYPSYPEVGLTYRHYKGGLYKVEFLSNHSETDEILVNYRSLHFGSYHSRPLDEWNKMAEDGKNRFKFVL